MKMNLTRIITALVLCALIGSLAVAKEKSRMIAFSKDFMVGSTQVKAGTYRVSFDEATSELSIYDKKSKTVLAKSPARLEKREGNSAYLEIRWADQTEPLLLRGISFPGDSQRIVLGEGGESAALR